MLHRKLRGVSHGDVPSSIGHRDFYEYDFELDGWASWDMPTEDYYDTYHSRKITLAMMGAMYGDLYMIGSSLRRRQQQQQQQQMKPTMAPHPGP
jgi:hypothetical protein